MSHPQANGLAQIIADVIEMLGVLVGMLALMGIGLLCWAVVIGVVLHFVVKYW